MGSAGSIIKGAFDSNANGKNDNARRSKSGAVGGGSAQVSISHLPDLVKYIRLFQHNTAGNIVILFGEGMDSQDSIEDKNSYYEVFLFDAAKEILRSYHVDLAPQEQDPTSMHVVNFSMHARSYLANPPKWESPFKRFPPGSVDTSLFKGEQQAAHN